MKKFKLTVLFLALAVVAAPGFSAAAQKSNDQAPTEKHEKPVPVVYSVHYVIFELANGKRINSRSYQTTVAAVFTGNRLEWGHGGSVRIGNRVPIDIGTGGPNGAQATSSYQYEDVGMDIDCSISPRAELQAGGVLLESSVRWQSVAGRDPASGNPILRNLWFSAPALVPLGKPTVIGTMDDTTSDHQFQIEVTVKRVE